MCYTDTIDRLAVRKRARWISAAPPPEKETIMSDDVGYVENGPEGKTCSVCKNFEPNSDNAALGKCMGYDVFASASCNYFESKAQAPAEPS
jgi:hypothetical protein